MKDQKYRGARHAVRAATTTTDVIRRSTIGLSRLSVRNNADRTNNILESFHCSLRRRIQVSHPNLFAFLGHSQRITTDYQADV